MAAGVGADDGHTTWRLHGGTSSPAPMAANGMPFATGIGRATVVHVGTILVVIQPTRLGYTDGERMPGLDVLMLGQRRQM